MSTNKKFLLISILLIFIPNLLGYIYDKLFRYSGNWLEDYQNHFKFSFLVISILGTVWLIILSKKEKKYIWLMFSVLVLLALLFYLYMGYAVVNMSFGF